MTAIFERRSIRKYKTTPVSHDDMLKIIRAGIHAPSAKNRQPWRFVVVEETAKNDMLNAMRKGLAREKSNPILPESGKYLAGVQNTINIMEQAPITLFIINPQNSMHGFPADLEARYYECANLQAIGACIQNMLLTAVDLGLGSLWNCDIFFAYDEIAAWLNTDEQIVAAVSFGIPDEAPNARPRNNIEDLLEWKK